MSVRNRLDRTANVLLTLLFLPGRLLEEGLHAAGALPWAEWVRVEINPQEGTAHTRVEFQEGTPGWAVWLAYTLPEVVAVAAGMAVLAWWGLGGDIWLPDTRLDWVLLALFGAQYLALALPSAADSDRSPEGGETPP